MTETVPIPLPIAVLPDYLANQIAAGEVVERPVSVVKELLENSFDAGAERIDVRIEAGGKRLIQVWDDGYGVVEDQIVLAVEPHATSKIRTTDDLFAIATFGFRGEALPSIASVSQFEMASRPAQQSDGAMVQLTGGKNRTLGRVAMPVGTRVTVRNLFFNTPARLKFLRGDKTEEGHIIDLIHRLALAHPHIGFRLFINDKEVLNVKSGVDGASMRHRLKALFGDEFPDNCLEFTNEELKYTVYGWLGVPTLNRTAAAGIHMFVNRRWVRDKILTHAVRESYRDLIPHDRYPLVGLFLDLPMDEVDVNVHPMKLEVRFRNQNWVHSLIRRSLAEALARFGSRSVEPPPTSSAPVTYKTVPSQPAEDGVMDHIPASIRAAQTKKWDSFYTPTKGYEPSKEFRSPHRDDGHENATYQRSLPIEDIVPSLPDEFPETPAMSNRLGRAVGQIHDTFVVVQSQDGLVIIDQHAAHERIVYEKLKDQYQHHSMERQGLLIPEVLEATPTEAEAIYRHRDHFRLLGIGLEPFGDNTFVIRSLPVLIASSSAKTLIFSLLDDLEQFGSSDLLQEQIDKLFATMACHGSVRANHKLSLDEMNALVQTMDQTRFAGQCSHGRPTYVKLTLSELEKMFSRK